MTKETALELLINQPYKLGHLLGFTKLTGLHNKWIKQMIKCDKDRTLQAHRGSYKTTCVSIALSILIILRPDKRILFMRKTDTDVKEVCRQVQNILESNYVKELVRAIYGIELVLTVKSSTEVSTNLTTTVSGTNQLVCIGIGGSLTGKHYDYIFTDDIVNLKDRLSRAEREHTKVIYQELQNVKNRGGILYNSGTPWHKDDCFTQMPTPDIYTCYDTGLITDEELAEIRTKLTASLFAANYELRHIAAEDVIFTSPHYSPDTDLLHYGISHIDAAYNGSDFTAYTLGYKEGDDLYILGKCWRKHVDDCLDDIIKIANKYDSYCFYCETNADKGYLAKTIRKTKNKKCVSYHESMNKFTKITAYIKPIWNNIYFVDGTDEEYINMICDFNDHCDHDDCPDSLASLIRVFDKNPKITQKEKYKPIWN